ncbi:cytochrome P450 [Artomyces pyxidatus]|uniref:Cytochrome P450 n=1 Tax=Artomyces pyxidatus TaxID=48021 RepID=A0ACB8SL28_9AGAM|nr:cytochrome P450 [Artomyces pyxidatus]
MVWLATQAALVGIALVVFNMLRLRSKQAALRKLPGPSNPSFLAGEQLCLCAFAICSWNVGNYNQMFHPATGGDFQDQMNKTYGSIYRISGPLEDTHVMISDPKALTNILLKDQDVFDETDWFLETNRHVLGLGLLSTVGAHHRKQRKLLTPVFSIKHMRSMVPLFHKITSQLRDILQKKVADGPQELDMMDWFGRLALELIAQGGLGYTFESLDTTKEDNDFGKAVKEYFPSLGKLVVFRAVYPLIANLPSQILRFGAKFIPFPSLHRLLRITDVLFDNTKTILEEKKALLEKGDADFTEQVGEGKDIISILLKQNLESSSEEDRLPEEDILGQMTTLLFAGTDTTSTALSRILSLLAQHQDVQDKLRKELLEAREAMGDRDIEYDELVALPYLEAVCRETLRLYPPVCVVARLCRKDISVPLSQPVQTTDGPITSLFVPNGATVFINIVGVNRDHGIWGDDADEWKPERWLAPLPGTVADAHIPGVYSNTLTFLGGGRSCIGFKFSQLEMKVVLSQLVECFRFTPTNKELVWRYAAITTPSIKGSTRVGPQLPVILERI